MPKKKHWYTRAPHGCRHSPAPMLGMGKIYLSGNSFFLSNTWIAINIPILQYRLQQDRIKSMPSVAEGKESNKKVCTWDDMSFTAGQHQWCRPRQSTPSVTDDMMKSRPGSFLRHLFVSFSLRLVVEIPFSSETRFCFSFTSRFFYRWVYLRYSILSQP